MNEVDKYIDQFPAEIQKRLIKIRSLLKKLMPDSEERIGYGMPAYYKNGPLVYFAAFKNHIGFYPTALGVAAFESELLEYKHNKGSVQFPNNKPLPLDLIKKIAIYRYKENSK